MKLLNITFLFAVIFLVACERDAKIPLPETEPKLVLQVFLGNGADTNWVYFGRTAPIFKRNSARDQIIANGRVVISSNGQSLQLQYHKRKNRYWFLSKEFAIEPGQTYLITAADASGKWVEGRTTIPQATPTQFDIEFVDSTLYPNENGGFAYYYLVRASFQNQDPTPAYYQVYGFLEDVFENEFTFAIDTTYTPLNYSQDVIFFEGLGILGRQFKPIFSQAVFFSDGAEDQSRYFFYLIKGNEAFRNTILSAYNSSDGDPFAEPANRYRNVSGGLGSVSGYLMEKRVLAR